MMTIATLMIGGCGGAPPSSAAEGEQASGEAVIIEEDDPRVSRSAGEEGGVVVLYPRVMGLPDQEPAALQAHMVELAQRVFPNRPLDVRPDPERVCPRDGCLGPSLGALLVAQNGTCATVAVVGNPGRGEHALLRWSGRLTVRDRVIPFREPPESHITLQEATPCEGLGAELGEEDYAVEEALRHAAAFSPSE
jgi:hypothetical protein